MADPFGQTPGEKVLKSLATIDKLSSMTNPTIGELASLTGNRTAASIFDDAGTPDVQQEFPEEPSTIQSGLAMLGRPGALALNFLAGGPTADSTGANWVTGREALTKWFGMKPDKRRGFSFKEIFQDPMEAARELAGLSVEIGADPLAYVGFGSLTPYGRALKSQRKLPGFFSQFGGDQPARSLVSFTYKPLGELDFPLSTKLDEAFSTRGAEAWDFASKKVGDVMPESIKTFAANTLRKAGIPSKHSLRVLEKSGRQRNMDAVSIQSMKFLEYIQRLEVLGVYDASTINQIRTLRETPRLMRDPNLSPQILEAVKALEPLNIDMSDWSKQVGTHTMDFHDSALASDPKFWDTIESADDLAGWTPRTESNFKSQRLQEMVTQAIAPGSQPTSAEFARLDITGRGISGGTEMVNKITRLDPEIDPDGTLRALREAAKRDKKARPEFEQAFRDRVQKYISPNIPARDNLGRIYHWNDYTGKIETLWDGQQNDLLRRFEVDGKIDRSKVAEVQTPMVSVNDKSGVLEIHFSANEGKKVRRVPYGRLKDKKNLSAIMNGDAGYTIDGLEYKVVKNPRPVMGFEEANLVDDYGGMVMGHLAPLNYGNKDRISDIAKMIVENDEIFEKGMYKNDLLRDEWNYLNRQAVRNASVESTYMAFGQAVKMGDFDPDGSSLSDLIENLKVNPLVARRRVFENAFGEDMLKRVESLDSRNLDQAKTIIPQFIPEAKEWTDKQYKSALRAGSSSVLESWSKKTRFSKDMARDIDLVSPAISNDTDGLFFGLMRKYSTLWKAATLAWPSRHFRDHIGNWHRIVEAGFARPEEAISDMYRAHRMFLGRGDKSLRGEGFKELHDEMRRIGLDPAKATDEEFTKAFKYMYAKHRGVDMTMREEMRADMSEGPFGGLRGLDRLTPGYSEPVSGGQVFVDTLKGRIGGVDRVPDKGNVLETLFTRPSDSSIPVFGDWLRINDAVADYTDSTGRLAAFYSQVKKGVPAAVAMENLQDALINYDPRKMNPFARKYIKSIVPFYSFWAGNLQWVGGQLLTRPGGRVGQMLKMYQNYDIQTDPTIPDWMREAVAVPYFEDRDDLKSYVTGFGFMTEDAIGTLSGAAELFTDQWSGTRKLLLEGGNRLNPLAKAPIELMTGTSLFQTDEEGGRRLSDLDPPIGRLLTNINQRYGDKSLDTPHGLTPAWLEYLSGVAPGVPRILRAANKILDTRDISTPVRALNLLTGMRVSTVDEAQQMKHGIESLQDMMREFEPVTYELPISLINADRLDQLPEDDRSKLVKMQEMLKQLQQRRKMLRRSE